MQTTTTSLLDQSVEGAGARSGVMRGSTSISSRGLSSTCRREASAATTRDPSSAAERDNLEAVLEYSTSPGAARPDPARGHGPRLPLVGDGASRARSSPSSTRRCGEPAGAVNFDPRMVGRALGVRAGRCGRWASSTRPSATRRPPSVSWRGGPGARVRNGEAMHLAVGGWGSQIGDLDEALASTLAAPGPSPRRRRLHGEGGARPAADQGGRPGHGRGIRGPHRWEALQLALPTRRRRGRRGARGHGARLLPPRGRQSGARRGRATSGACSSRAAAAWRAARASSWATWA